MGVNCRIVLPPAARVADVADVLGLLCGCPARRVELNPDAHAVWVDHVTVEAVGEFGPVVGLARLTAAPPSGRCPDGEPTHRVLYHFEGPGGCRLLSPPSTAFWLAAGRRLADFFGGDVDYQDGDGGAVDYTNRPAGDDLRLADPALVAPEDGPEWDAFQQRKAAVGPITADEWRACDRYAAYKIDDPRATVRPGLASG